MTAAIRLATPGDASGMLAIYAPVVRETATSFELEPPSEAEFRRRIRDTLAKRPWLACEIDGEVAGYAYAGAHRTRAAYGWSVEPSIYVSPHHRRKSVATALYTSLFACLKAQGYYNAYAGMTLPNEASAALHRSFGFEPVGTYRAVGYKLGKWHDVAWWQLSLRKDRAVEPEPPRALEELIGTPAWERALREGTARLRR